ncbi:MAG: hypothetical protein Kow00120_03890 [Anaerolineae bacterium]
MPKTRGDWLQLLAAIGYVGLSGVFYFVLRDFLNDPAATAEQLRAAGVLGPVVYILLYWLQIFIPFLPGVSMDLVSGALWGVLVTLFLSEAAAASAGAIVIVVVRRLGLQTLDERFPALLKGSWRFLKLVERWPWTLVIISTLAGDVGYFLAGATRLPVWKACLVMGVARVPGILIYSTLGWALQNGLVAPAVADNFNALVTGVSVLTIGGLLIGVAILGRYGSRIIARLEKALETSEGAPAQDQPGQP